MKPQLNTSVLKAGASFYQAKQLIGIKHSVVTILDKNQLVKPKRLRHNRIQLEQILETETEKLKGNSAEVKPTNANTKANQRRKKRQTIKQGVVIMVPHKIPRRLSSRARAFNWLLRCTAKPAIFFFHDHPTALKAFDIAYTQACTLLKFNHTPRAIKITPEKLTHCEGEWLRARGIDEQKVIYYLHGGAYFLSSPKLHRSVTWRLSSFTRRAVFALDYRDAPTHDITHCLEDAVEGYEFLLKSGFKPENIIIAGDSAGGHLSLLTLQYLRDHKIPMPAAALLISPWTDLSCQSESLQKNNLSDPFFWGHAIKTMGRFFTSARDASIPLLSPVNGDFKDLPPLMFLVGSIEVLRDDARRAAERAFDAGVKVCYEEWQDMPHIFPFFSNVIPEGRKAFKHMAAFVRAVENKSLTQFLKQHTALHAKHPSEQICTYA